MSRMFVDIRLLPVVRFIDVLLTSSRLKEVRRLLRLLARALGEEKDGLPPFFIAGSAPDFHLALPP